MSLNPPGVQYLDDLSDQQDWSFEQLWAAVARAARLTKLELSGPKWEALEPEEVTNFNKLARLTALQQLSVSQIRLPQVHLPSTLSSLACLEFHNAETESFAVMGVLTCLECLDLGCIKVSIGWPIPGLPNLDESQLTAWTNDSNDNDHGSNSDSSSVNA